MEVLPAELQDLKVLRRLFFCCWLSSYLRTYQSTGPYWVPFLLNIQEASVSVRLLSEHLWKICVTYNEDSFATNYHLAKEIHSLTFPSNSNNTLGIVLISPNDTCKKCGGTLLIRGDRPSKITLYCLITQFWAATTESSVAISGRVQFYTTLWI